MKGKNEKTRQITHCCKKKKAIFKLQPYPTSTLVWSMDLIQEHLYKKRIKNNLIMNEIWNENNIKYMISSK